MQNYINNIDSCLLITFSEVMKTRNYKLLYINKNSRLTVILNWIGEKFNINRFKAIKYDETLANEAWLHLYDEFNEGINTSSVDITFEIIKQIDVLKSEYIEIKDLLFFILEWHRIMLLDMFKLIENKKFYYDLIDQLIKRVNYFNYRFDKEKGIGKEVERITKQVENYKTRIASNEAQLEDINKDTKKKTFGTTIAAISKFMSFRMDDKVALREFINYYNLQVESNKPAPKE
ncbi:hypothetical protein DRO61_11625 [Candidatus Bathyarchaeota archaeon]|nr:MAG: hypothetical protein DRO61_11625 [Candidatus Bathyarchaeota archaeon]